MILFKDRRTGAEVMVKAVALTPERLSKYNLGLGNDYLAKSYGTDIDNLHKVVPHTVDYPDPVTTRRHQALWDDRVPTDLRNRIIDMQGRINNLPDGFNGGKKLHKDRNDLATEIINREDLPAKLQRKLLQMVLDNAPIASVGSQVYEDAPPMHAYKPYPGKYAR
jgi:hypothetical protein